MDQQFMWNSMLLNPAEFQSMQGYIISPGDRNISYTNMGNYNSAQSNMWSSGGSNYGHYSQSQGNHEETKVEHGLMSPLIIASSSALRTGENNYEVANSLENVNLNLNISQHSRQLLPENPSMHAVRQDPEYVADQVGLGNEFAASLTPYPYVLDFLDSDPSSVGSSNRCGTSYTSSGSEQENDERSASLTDQRTACKRKSIETLLAQTSVFAASTSQSQPHIPVGPGVRQAIYPMHWNGAPSMRSYNIENGLIPRRAEATTRNIPVNNILAPTADIGQMRHEPTNWTLGSRDISIAAPCISRTHPSSVLHPSIGSTRGSNFPLQNPSQSFVSQELSQLGRAAPRSSHPAPHIRSTYMSNRQNDSILAVPLPLNMAVTRETTRRIMLEVHQAMDALSHRGDATYETAALASTNLHDRHRDMRLDVDNMSYEELLALGEYIGNVSTGLNEEIISKCLKRRKFLSVMSVESMDIEPCCICREEYLSGEEIGTLDCGHEFHSPCISQWLAIKNICPICKNTALVT